MGRTIDKEGSKGLEEESENTKSVQLRQEQEGKGGAMDFGGSRGMGTLEGAAYTVGGVLLMGGLLMGGLLLLLSPWTDVIALIGEGMVLSGAIIDGAVYLVSKALGKDAD